MSYSVKPKTLACKVVILGESGCGKSCLFQRYLHSRFIPDDAGTVGAAFGAITLQTKMKRDDVEDANTPLTSDTVNVSLQIWDTAGQERYQSIVSLYYRNAKAAIICCDLTDYNSFKKIPFWLDNLKMEEHDCAVYICGNKLDLITNQLRPREVTMEHLRSFQASAYETSSKENYNVSKVFTDLVENFVENHAPRNDPCFPSLDIKHPVTKGKRCCRS